MHPDPYFNQNVRVVSRNLLEAMLQRESMIAHRYWIQSVSDRYVTVCYSNPDEYGYERRAYIMLPCYNYNAMVRVKAVVLDVYKVWGGRDGNERDCIGMMFDHLMETMPELWRCPDGEWRTKEEIEAREAKLQTEGVGV